MANYTYTRAELVTAAKHAIGGNPDSNQVLADVVNDALQYLTDCHPWRWLDRALSLNFVASQNYVALPADFKAIRVLKLASSLIAAQPCTLNDIQTMRAYALPNPTFTTWYALSITPQTSTTAEPIFKLELYPTPTANATAAMIGTYQRIIPELSSDSHIADIPAPWQPALKSLVRGMAIADQKQEESIDWKRAMDLIENLKDLDGIGMPNLGGTNSGVSSFGGIAGGDMIVSGTIVY